jgi:hypothetical protein
MWNDIGRLLLVSLLGCACEVAPTNGAVLEEAAGFGQSSNILIADQFNNRVIEIDPTSGKIVWHFGLGPDDTSARSIIGVNDAQRVGGALTLMAGTGAPAGTEPACPPAGCADNRVLLVNRDGKIVWQYGQFGVTGSGPDQLSSPVQNTWLPNGHVLITDQGNQRIIEVGLDKKIHWQYGETGVSGDGPDQLDNPNSAELLENGHILISDENNNRAIEVRRDHSIVKTFTAGGTVSGVAFASRLPDGDTLLTDSNNNRIVEVDANDSVVWQFVTNTRAGSNPAPLPTRAVRLRNGNTLISDQFNHQVIVVDQAGAIVTAYGNLNVAGYGTDNVSQGLNGPYDAKVVGDFTGLTSPFDEDGREDREDD